MNTPDDSARRPLKSRSTRWARALSAMLVARRISPNVISTAGIGFACAGAAAMWCGARGWLPVWLALVLGALGAQLRLLCNLMDGLVAVEGGLKSKAGDLFNEAPDRIEDAVLLIGAGHICGHAELGWLCAALALGTAYLRALGASLGLGQDYRGPGAKQHRMAVLTLGLLGGAVVALLKLDAPVLVAALWVVAGLTAITVARRTAHIYSRLP